MKNKYLRVIKQPKNFRILMMSIVFSFLLIAIFFFETFSSYKSEMKSAEVQTSNLAQVLEEQISTSFKKIDIVLDVLQDEIADIPKSRASTALFNKLLLAHRLRLPEVLSIKIVDKEGEFLGDDTGVLSNTNLRDREYYQILKKSNIDEMIISKPVISKTMHFLVVVLARPILDSAGKFNGLILATIPVEHFRKIFISLNVGERGTIFLYGFDKILYALNPWSEKFIGKYKLLSHHLLELITSDRQSKIYRTISPLDGNDRIVTGRKIGHFPFVIGVGLSIQEFLYSWEIRTISYTLLVFYLLTTFCYFLLNFLVNLEELDEQRKQSIQSAKLSSLGEMASGIAHEINNPLTIISSLAMTLKKPKSVEKADIKLNESLDKMILTVERIAKIIRGLRSFSRDSFDDPMIPTSLKKIFECTMDLTQEKIKNRNILLTIKPFDDVLVECREIQIAQVLMNLISNSIDVLHDLETRWITIEVQNKDEKVFIFVSDSGIKIKDEVVAKIMQPFFTTKEIGKGTGLGLSISKGIIENHHGHFSYDHKATHTTFIIELPLAAPR
jgi:signal transduction histidine kinase/Na+-transporting methylmalonyl-CoA/oxaloacetate decarboxylase gamma subunit